MNAAGGAGETLACINWDGQAFPCLLKVPRPARQPIPFQGSMSSIAIQYMVGYPNVHDHAIQYTRHAIQKRRHAMHQHRAAMCVHGLARAHACTGTSCVDCLARPVALTQGVAGWQPSQVTSCAPR